MTKLKSVKEGYNKFCGPAVLSILTGKSTDECADVIKQVNKQYQIRGVFLSDLLQAANKLGFSNSQVETNGSLFRTLIALVNFDGIYIVSVPEHFVCIEVKNKKIYFCDNHTKEPIEAANSARLNQEVLSAHRVVERVKTDDEINAEQVAKLLKDLEQQRLKFIEEIRHAADDIKVFAHEVSKSIGDVSYKQAQDSIMRMFISKLRS